MTNETLTNENKMTLSKLTKFREETNNIKEFTQTLDNVNHPSHYTDGKIEVIDYIEDKKLGFCLGNAIKYISRAGKKKSGNMSDKEKEINDLRKAVWYIERRIKELNSVNITNN